MKRYHAFFLFLAVCAAALYAAAAYAQGFLVDQFFLPFVDAHPYVVRKFFLPVATGLFPGASVDDPVMRARLARIIFSEFSMLFFVLVEGIIGYWYAFVHCMRACTVRSAEYSTHDACRDSEARVSMPEVAGVIAIVAVAVAFRVRGIADGFSYDELSSASHYLMGSLWGAVAKNYLFNNHIACTVLAWCAKQCLGSAEWALRSPSLVLGMLTIVAVYVFCRRHIPRFWAFMSALAFAVLPAHVVASQTMRGYAGLCVCALVSSMVYLKLLEHVSKRTLLLYGAAAVAGIWFHLYGVLVAGVQYGYLVLCVILCQVTRQRAWCIDRRSFVALSAAFPCILFVGALAYLPSGGNNISFFVEGMVGSWYPGIFRDVLMMAAGQTGDALAAFSAVLCLLGVVSMLQRQPRLAGYCILVMVVPLVGAFLLRPYLLYARFFVFVCPFYVFFEIMGLARLFEQGFMSRHPVMRGGIRVVCAAVALYGFVAMGITAWQGFVPEGYRDAARYMQAGATSETVFCSAVGTPDQVQYYFDRPLVIPQTAEEMRLIVARATDVRCIYRDESWMPPVRRAIARALEPVAESREFNGVVVYIVKQRVSKTVDQ